MIKKDLTTRHVIKKIKECDNNNKKNKINKLIIIIIIIIIIRQGHLLSSRWQDVRRCVKTDALIG